MNRSMFFSPNRMVWAFFVGKRLGSFFEMMNRAINYQKSLEKTIIL